MSAEERINLDVTYAKNHSFWYDLKIMLKTPFAIIQKETFSEWRLKIVRMRDFKMLNLQSYNLYIITNHKLKANKNSNKLLIFEKTATYIYYNSEL